MYIPKHIYIYKRHSVLHQSNPIAGRSIFCKNWNSGIFQCQESTMASFHFQFHWHLTKNVEVPFRSFCDTVYFYHLPRAITLNYTYQILHRKVHKKSSIYLTLLLCQSVKQKSVQLPRVSTYDLNSCVISDSRQTNKKRELGNRCTCLIIL